MIWNKMLVIIAKVIQYIYQGCRFMKKIETVVYGFVADEQ